MSYFVNEVKIEGESKVKKEFIKKFLRYGFESYFPVPEVLVKYNVEMFPHKKLIEKVLGKKLTAWFTELYSEEAKKELLEKLEKYDPANKREERLKQEILKCLTTTGYISLWDFRENCWGTDRNAWDVEYDEKEDVLRFKTAWNPPTPFFTAVSKKLNLSFFIKTVNSFSTTCKTMIIGKDGITEKVEFETTLQDPLRESLQECMEK